MIPKSLSEANDLILEYIAHSEESTVLGFLPLSAAEEDALLALVRSGLRGDSGSTTALYLMFPGAMAYALAAAPSRALQEGGQFWPSLVNELGIDVPVPARQSFAHEFRRECKHLGLLDGTLENAAWRYAVPFIFQSGILHYWKDDLAAGLRSVLRHRPAPDTEDPAALREFTNALSGAIYHQANLRKMLDTAAGPLLVTRLVSGYLSDDWSRLPAHLREPVRDAFSASGRGVVLRSPHLSFDTAFEQLVVVLPAQAKGIASPETYWKIGTSRFAARKETVIPARELGGDEIAIGLHRLEQGFEDRSFAVDSRIGDACPFRIFRKACGRELRANAGVSADLPPAEYVIVTAANVTAGESESPVLAEPFIYYDLELRPGDAPLVLTRDGVSWTIGAKLEPGLFIDREAGRCVTLEDGSLLHYGQEPGLIAYFPGVEGEAGEFRLSVHCPEQSLKFETEIAAPAREQGGYRFVSELHGPLAAAFGSLPAGIHRLQVAVSDKARQASRTFWHWKGLESISDTLGFRCSTVPENLDIKGSRGVVVDPRGLVLARGYHAPFVRLQLKRPQEALILPRAGVRVTLIEPGTDWEDEPSKGGAVTVDAKDKRLLKFTSGGFHPWKIMGGNREIAVLDHSRTVRVFSLAGIAAEIGGSGRITAVSDDGTEVPLLVVTRPLSATAPRMIQDHGRGLEVWSFKIPIADLDAVGISVTDLSARPDEPSGEVLKFADRAEEGFTCSELELPGAPVKLVASYAEANGVVAPPRVKVRLEIRYAELSDGLWAIDFFRRATGESDWLNLDSDEKHGYSKVRIFAWGSAFPAPDSGWWRHLRRAERPDDRATPPPLLTQALASMSEADLDAALQTCRKLLEWKYPANVWKENAHRLQDFPDHLSRHRFAATDQTAATWWKHGAAELSGHSRSAVTPVVRQFIFGSQPDCLSLHGHHLAVTETGTCPVAVALNFPATVAADGGLKNRILPAFQAGEIDAEAIFSFSNFSAVSTGREQEFIGFSLVTYLRGGSAGITGLEKRIENLHSTSPYAESAELLGPAQMLHAINALNRRCRVVEESSLSDEETPLTRMAQTLERISQQLEMVGPVVGQKTGWSPAADPIWYPPRLENITSKKVAGIVWVLCGLSRLAANQHLAPSEYEKLRSRLLDPGMEGRRMLQNRICILLSLAPELFALFIALFELKTYKPLSCNARA